jgi:hypothetical protein
VIFQALIDLVVLLHFSFILFAIFGGLLALRWRCVLWIHAPAALWAALIEFGGWLCPLTPLENWLRAASGRAGYPGGFIEHYVVPIVYPPGLTRELQVVLGVLVIIVNVVVYLLVWRRRLRASMRR